MSEHKEIIRETIEISTEFIKLDSFLKFAGMLETGEMCIRDRTWPLHVLQALQYGPIFSLAFLITS